MGESISPTIHLNNSIMQLPQYQINVNQDPLLNRIHSSPDYIKQLEEQLAYAKFVNSQNNYSVNNPKDTNLWEEITKEIESLNEQQRNMLFEDTVYQDIDKALQTAIQTELINSVKDKIASSSTGKELLIKHLSNIRDKKTKIIADSNKDIELFKKFQIAAQTNPNLTYNDFINAIK